MKSFLQKTKSLTALFAIIALLLMPGLGWGQTNPQTGTLPYSFTGAATIPNTMAIHRFGTTAGAIPTTRTTSDGNGDLPSTTTNNAGGYMIEGTSGADGVSLLASSSQAAGAIVVEVSTTAKTGIVVSWVSWTKLNQDSYTMSIALQYRVGESGTWINVDNPSSSVYSTSIVGRINATSFTQNLPVEAENKPIVQIRWIYWASAGSSGSRDRLGIDEISITGSAVSCVDPTTQASNVTFSNILSDQMTVGWTRGGTPGDGVIVVAKAGSAPDDPTDGTSYTANAAFGAGTQIGTGTYVVFMGSGTSVNVTGLSASATYYYKVYEKNCTGTSIMINTTSPAEGNQATAAACAVNPTITTTVAANAITPTAASSGGSGLSSGENCAISVKGVCWNTSTGPTTSNLKTTDGAGANDFTSAITSLSAQTLYYARAYATNSFGTAYGPEITFRTLSTELTAHPATFTATAASSSQINLTFSAASSITNADGYIILRRTGSNPTITNITDGIAPTALTMPSGTTFLSDINSTSTTTYSSTGLPNPNTQYNYAIIAYNWDGVNPETYNYYTGGTIRTTFATTLAQAITVPYSQSFEGSTSEWVLATAGTNKWAIGSATNNGGSNSLYISNNSGTTNAYTITSAQAGTDASLIVDLTAISSATLSFDWKSNGEFFSGNWVDYGEVYINTGSSDILLSESREFRGNISFLNKRISLTNYVGGVVTLKFRWVNDASVGNQPPFAVDNVSIVEGDFPTLSTTAISSISANSAVTGGDVTDNGGSTVSNKGVVYGITSNPTLANSYTSDGTGTGAFTSNLSGLVDNTTYYVRAYATNSTGTAYGNELSFTTSSVSTPVATAASTIGVSGFTANWDVVSVASGGYLLDVSSSPTFGTGTPAAFNEGFESGLSSSGYVSSSLNLTSGTWNFVESGLRNDDENSGTYSCQLRASTGTATTPALNDIGTLSFYAKAPGGSSTLTISKIINSNSTVVEAVSISSTWAQYVVNINDNSSAIQIVFACGSNYTLIDDISIGYSEFTPSYVSGYEAKPIAGQSTDNSIVFGLTPLTTYYYRVRSVGANSTSANSNTITVTTGANKVTTEPGDWNSLVWNPAGTPTQIDDVIIDHAVILAGNADCNNLTIGTGSLTVASGGSLLPRGTATGNVTLQRNVGSATWTDPEDGWHLLSSPVANQVISPAFTETTASDYDFYAWDEASNFWLNQKEAANNITTFSPGKGYLVSYKNEGTKSFNGTLNVADQSVSLTKTGSSEYSGFNLIGNPFSSAITWVTGWTLGSVGGVAYVYDESVKDYISRTAGNPIPAMNGFMVYLSSGTTQELTIPAQARAHNVQSWFKSSEERIVLFAVDKSNDAAKESVIRFDPDATESFDLAYDGYYLQGYAPKFYSVSDNQYFGVNTLPVLTESLVIPLGFEKTEASEFAIEMREALSGALIYLTDMKTNTTVNLTQNPVYNFTSETGDDTNRFKLTFGSVGIDNPAATSSISVYTHGEILYISGLNAKAEISVVNLTGQVVISSRSNGSGLHSVNAASLPKGVYVVSVISNGQAISRKVVL